MGSSWGSGPPGPGGVSALQPPSKALPVGTTLLPGKEPWSGGQESCILTQSHHFVAAVFQGGYIATLTLSIFIWKVSKA